LDWCPYCNDFDHWGYGHCQGCGASFVDLLLPAPEPPQRSFDVEVFGVGRSDDGATTNYIRLRRSDERLAALRSMPYADFLETAEWQDVRTAALEAADWRCQVCNTDHRPEVHHRTYDRLGEELLEDVTVLCRDCHQRVYEDVTLVPGGDPPPPRRVRLVFPAEPAL
jgi:hypothetical protein